MRVGVRLVPLCMTTAALAVLAPWESGMQRFVPRLAEFLACALIWEVAVGLTLATARRRWGLARVSTATGLATAILAASVPATAAMAGVFALAENGPGPLMPFCAKSLLLGLVITFARRGLYAAPPGASDTGAREAKPGGATGAPGTFLRRHAPGLAGSRLVALQAEDHYLRIHTDAGSALVLLRLRDAAAELEGVGWQPHRSFWLAHGAGGRAVRRGQAWQVELAGGLVVPVSKAAVPAMRAVGYASTA